MDFPWGFGGGLRGHRRSICVLACCIAGSLRTTGAEAGQRRQGKEDLLFFDGDTGTAWPGEGEGKNEEEEEEEEEQQQLLCRRRSRRRKKAAAGMGMSVSKAFVGMKALLYEDGIADPTAAVKMLKKKKTTKRVCRKRETEQQTIAMACPNSNCPSSLAFSSSSSQKLFLSSGGDEQQRSEWPADGKFLLTTNGACRNPSCCCCCGSSLQFSPFNGDEKQQQQQQHGGENDGNGNNNALEWPTESILSMMNRACPNPSSSLQLFPLDNINERQQQWQQQRGGGGRGEESEWLMEPLRGKVLSAADTICRIPTLCDSPPKLFPPSRDERQQQQRGGDAASEWTLESLQEGPITATMGKVCGNLSFASPLQLFPFGRGKQQRGDGASGWPAEFLQGQIPLTEKGGTNPSFGAASLQLFPLSRDEQQRGGCVSEWPTAFLLGQIPSIDRTRRNPSSSMQLFPLDRDDEQQQREEDVSEWPKETLRGQVPSIDRDGRNTSFARTSQLFPSGRGEQQQGGGEEAPEWLTELRQGKVLSTNKLIPSVRDEENPNWGSPLELFPVTSSRDGPLAGGVYHFGSSSGTSHIERETEEEKIHILSSASACRSPDHSSSFELFPLDRGSASGNSARGIEHRRGKGVLEWSSASQEQVLGRVTGTSNCSPTLKVFPIDGDEDSDSGWVEHRRDTEGPSEWTFVEREYNQGQCEISNYSSSSLEVVPIDEGEDSEGGWVKYRAGNHIYYEFGRGMKRERELDQGQVIMGRASGGISNCSSSSLEISPINGDNGDEVSESGGQIEHQGGEEELALDWPTERETEGECNQGQSGISNNSSSSEVFPIDGDDGVLESNGIGYRREERELDRGQVIIGRASRNPSSSSSSSYSSSLSESSSSSSESAIIPGLNEDTASRCIALASRSAYGALSLTSKGLWQLIRTGRIFKLRREMGVKEPWIYMYAQGGDGVPMMMAAGVGDSASPWRAFDPSERKWLTLPPSPADFSFLMSDKESLAAGTHLLWMGHDILGYSIFRYDLVSHTWARGPSMNSARCLFASASSSIYGYVAGGNLDGALLKSVERYNSELQQWERLPDMNHARHNASGCYMDGKFYVIGGCDNKWKPLEKSEVFDPILGTWTEIPSMLPKPPLAGPGSRSHWSAPPLIAVVNDNLYSIDPVQNAIQIYRKADNTWHTLGLAPVQTDVNFGWGLAFKGVGDNLIVIGGYQDPKGSRGMAIFAWNPVLAGGNPPYWTMLTFMIGGFNSFLCNCAVMSC